VLDGQAVSTDVGYADDVAYEVDKGYLKFLRSKDHNDQYFLEFCQLTAAVW
jgi:hypothetical protein